MPRPQLPIGYFAAIWRFFRDPNGSKLGKLFVLATIVYIIMPLDFIPDLAPIIGWIDDIGLAALATAYLVRVAKQYRQMSMLPQPTPQPAIPMPEYDAYVG
jgi:uncharacterized membrane protein YkvA (DUF1232 family)